MKIAICADGKTITSPIHPDFRSSKYFLFFETKTGSIAEIVENPAIEEPEDGEKESALMVIRRDADVLLAGDITARAGDVLGTSNIEVYTVRSGTVKGAIDRFLANELPLRSGPYEGLYPGEGSPATDTIRKPASDEEEWQTNVEGAGQGPADECVCPFCGEAVPHKGTPCREMECPQCHAPLVDSYKKFQ